MGLDLLQVATYGIFCEAVIRRCSWDQLTFDNTHHDRTLVKTTGGPVTRACGMIGFYIKQTAATTPECIVLLKKYTAELVEYGSKANDYICNDLGVTSPDLYKLIMMTWDHKVVTLEYYKLSYSADTNKEYTNSLLAQFRQFCRTNDHICLGLLPFKILRTDYHIVHPRPGYLDTWRPKMLEVLSGIDEAKLLPMEKRAGYIYEWCIKRGYAEPEPDPTNGSAANATGFDDEIIA